MSSSDRFSLRNKKVFLTYPQMHLDFTAQEMLDEFKYTHQRIIDFSYIICCKEKHQDGNYHYHIYFEAREVVRTTCQRYFDLNFNGNVYHPNIEPVTKTPWKTVQYVMKDGDYAEYLPENRPMQSLQSMTKSERNKFLRENDPLDLYNRDEISVIQAANMIKAKQSIMYYAINKTKRRDPPVVLWFYGETGTGKTRTAIELAEEAGCSYWLSHGEKLQWFDGYTGQEYAIIDDFRRNMCTFNFFLRLTDRYTLQVPVKGGFTNWIPKVIIITSPIDRDEAYEYFDQNTRETKTWDKSNQLARRIPDENVIEF